MKMLIIDDADYKIDAMRDVVSNVLPKADIQVARSFQTGLHAIEASKPDLILLDMTLPTSERSDKKLDGRMRFYGGRELMAEMELIEVESKVIIVTQFDNFPSHPNSTTLSELLDTLKRRFPKIYLGGVHYDTNSGAWRSELEILLKQLPN
ncbi:MAG: response regulator [Prosthecobacter sp.]